MVFAVGLNNIPREPAANIKEGLQCLANETPSPYILFASIPLAPRYFSKHGKIREVNEWIYNFNKGTTGCCLLLDDPSLTFLRDRLHLDGKSKAEVAIKLSSIFDSFLATLA